MHQAERRDRARPSSRPVPSYRRSCSDRGHAKGKRLDRDRAHRRGELAADRQPSGVEDPSGGSRRLDRALPRRDQRPPIPSPACGEGDGRGQTSGGLMPVRLATVDAGFEAAFAWLLDAKRETAADVDGAVAAIIEDVARRGDAALIDYTRRFDGVDLEAFDLRLTAR